MYFLVLLRLLVSDDFSLLHLLHTRELQQLHGIPFKGFTSLQRQILQIALNLVRPMLVVRSFSVSYKRSNFLLPMFVKGKSIHSLQNQIFLPGLISCMSLYFLSLILAQVL